MQRNCVKYLHVSYHGWRRFCRILLPSSDRTLQTHSETNQNSKKLCPGQMLHLSALSVPLMKNHVHTQTIMFQKNPVPLRKFTDKDPKVSTGRQSYS